MESLAEQTWDAVICGTGLQQSLLALALSRSGKQILHLDPNEFYGGNEAALTLDEAGEWVRRHGARETEPGTGDAAWAAGSGTSKPIFTSASITKSDDSASFPLSSRAYSLSLSPFIIHTRSALLSQLVSSRAYRQLEFLSVGAFYIFQPAEHATQDASASVDAPTEPNPRPKLTPIPSTREAIFATDAIQPRPKRALMKFLKFVLDHDSPENAPKWHPHASQPLAPFLESEFKLDSELRTLVLALTLSLDPDTLSVQDCLATVRRHLTSMGVFGPGFAAVYPKYGGGSEVAQVGCRACAVGGAVYMLGTGAKGVRLLDKSAEEGVHDKMTEGEGEDRKDDDGARFEVELGADAGVKVRTRTLFRERDVAFSSEEGQTVSRLVVVVDSPLGGLFVPTVQDTPNPGVAVVAIPPGSVKDDRGEASKYPVYVLAHSSETGECPAGRSILYFTTTSTPSSASVLDGALLSVLPALSDFAKGDVDADADEAGTPQAIYHLRYQQTHASPASSDGAESGVGSSSWTVGNDGIFTFPTLPPDLAFDDASLDPVKAAWKHALGSAAVEEGVEERYMQFEDREGLGDDA